MDPINLSSTVLDEAQETVDTHEEDDDLLRPSQTIDDKNTGNFDSK
jgi:hypothetical protein